MQNTTGILIGRFQPLHAGHRELIRQARALCSHLIVIVGSADSARSMKNPFTYAERKIEIQKFLLHEDLNSVDIVPINDYKYSNTQWISDVTSIVNEYSDSDKQVILFGFEKEGNNYLKWFPQYKFRNITTPYEICSTDIRKIWFESGASPFTPEVIDDYIYFENEKKLFAGYPFPETLSFNCSDALIECSGHILLIQRGRAPGRGNLALPGGFKNRDETFLDCAVREVFEETNLRVPENVLRGSLVDSKLFDDPTRNDGIPRVTKCFHFHIKPNADGSLPRANGADDAIDCGWYPIREVMDLMPMFSDHRSIISSMLSVTPTPAHLIHA